MAKKPTITTITSANDNITTHNANYNALRDAFDAFVSRDGATPNTLTADVDMNSQSILNAAAVRTSVLYLGGVLTQSLGNLANWGGEWTTTTAYDAYDIVYHRTNNIIYRCLEAHTSGTFATDLAAGKWEIYIGDGLFDDENVTGVDGTVVTGTAGTNGNLAEWNADGDLVDSLPITGTGTDVVVGAISANITSGNVATFTASQGIEGTVDILDEDDMVSDSATDLATQQSIKAYVDGRDLGDLADVDLVTAAPTDGQTIVWVAADSEWAPGDVGSGGGSSTYTGFAARRTTAFSTAVQTRETIVFNSEIRDADSAYDNTTGVFTVPSAYNGKMMCIGGSIRFTANNQLYVHLQKSTDSGSTWLDLTTDSNGSGANGASPVTVDEVATGDLYRLQTYSGAAGAFDVANLQNRFYAYVIGD